MAIVEAATGLCLLFLPDLLFAVLLGIGHATTEAILIGRLAGAALLAIGIASWMARTDTQTPSHLGLLTGILVYNGAAATLLGIHGEKKNAPDDSGAITFSGTFSGTLVGARSGAGAGAGV